MDKCHIPFAHSHKSWNRISMCYFGARYNEPVRVILEAILTKKKLIPEMREWILRSRKSLCGDRVFKEDDGNWRKNIADEKRIIMRQYEALIGKSKG